MAERFVKRLDQKLHRQLEQLGYVAQIRAMAPGAKAKIRRHRGKAIVCVEAFPLLTHLCDASTLAMMSKVINRRVRFVGSGKPKEFDVIVVKPHWPGRRRYGLAQLGTANPLVVA